MYSCPGSSCEGWIFLSLPFSLNSFLSGFCPHSFSETTLDKVTNVWHLFNSMVSTQSSSYLILLLLFICSGHLQLFATPWTAAYQASLSFTISQSLLKLMSMELVMPSHHLILYHPLLFLPSIFPRIRVFFL